MSAKEAYDQKIEKGLRRPTLVKAQAKSYPADTRMSHSKNAETIQQWIAATKLKLKELGKISDGACKRNSGKD